MTLVAGRGRKQCFPVAGRKDTRAVALPGGARDGIALYRAGRSGAERIQSQPRRVARASARLPVQQAARCRSREADARVAVRAPVCAGSPRALCRVGSSIQGVTHETGARSCFRLSWLAVAAGASNSPGKCVGTFWKRRAVASGHGCEVPPWGESAIHEPRTPR
jgi:hypothetical protein